jgi:hypothetical protein
LDQDQRADASRHHTTLQEGDDYDHAHDDHYDDYDGDPPDDD